MSLAALLVIMSTFVKYLYFSPEISKMPSNIESFISTDVNSELVIARYNESLEWLNTTKTNYFKNFNKIICYNKGPTLSLESLQFAVENPKLIDYKTLPNVGRESHTYLTHIINNYNNLPDITVFVTGSCDGEYKWYKTINTMRFAFDYNNSAFLCEFKDSDFTKIGPFSIKEYVSSDKNNLKENDDKVLIKSQYYPFDKYYEHFFNGIPLSYFCLRGIFAVSRVHIHNRPVEFYQQLLELVNSSPNPEAGHYIERSWVSIFNKLPEECLYEIPAYITKEYYKDGIIVSNNNALEWPFQPKE
jgi:hypothetical protein